MKPMLATAWSGEDPARWLMSQKLDGLRAIWTGKELLSREGHAFRPPAWWTAGLPDMVLDGELYGGPGTLSKVSGMFRRSVPIDAEWRAVRLHVYDAPEARGGIVEREAAYRVALDGGGVAVAVEHVRCIGVEHLVEVAAGILAAGGEGVCLRHPSASYQPGRSRNLVKFKPAEFHQHEIMMHLAMA